MNKKQNKKQNKIQNKIQNKLPFVSVCTPTFNRRPFIPYMIKCFENQIYPKENIEWIIVDDGTDKVEDLVINIPQVKYFKFDEKMTLGKKRNILNEKAKGDIILYMDDDDYYPAERISHAVDVLNKNPKVLCVGSSIMYIYFKHINKMYQFGPYGPNHATAATFAFRKELLKQTKFDELSCVAEEKKFLKDYTIPFAQLESNKTILVFSHIQNSFDKKELLNQMPNPYIHDTEIIISNIVKEPEILNFFMNEIDELLNNYEPGKLKYKPDVIKQINEIKETREKMILDYNKNQTQYKNLISKHENKISPKYQSIIDNLTFTKEQLINENNQLKEKVQYLEEKIKKIINNKIEEIKNNK